MPSLTALKHRLSQRRRLRQPTGLRFAIADTLDQLNPQHWDAVVEGQSWFFSRAYLGVLEAAPPACLAPRYALVSDDGGPIAAVVMQWAELERERLRPRPGTAAPAEGRRARLKQLLGRAAADGGSAVATRLSERVLVCGNLLSYGMHAVAIAPDVAPDAVWPAVAEVLYRVRRAEKLAGQAGFVMIKDVTADHAPALKLLDGLSYRGVETEPNMVLALPEAWKTHADYLAGMASKYRSAVKNQILEPVRQAGLALRAFEPDAALQARMHALYLQVHENASLRPFTLHPDYFGALASAAGPRLRYSGLFRADAGGGETLLGFIATLLDGPSAVAYHIGFDRAAAAEHPLYLRLLHASIEQAIELGAREVSFGRTALDPKARLGAKPQPMQVWVRHRQPVINQITRRMLGLVRHEEAPERNPFKAAPPA